MHKESIKQVDHEVSAYLTVSPFVSSFVVLVLDHRSSRRYIYLHKIAKSWDFLCCVLLLGDFLFDYSLTQ